MPSQTIKLGKLVKYLKSGHSYDLLARAAVDGMRVVAQYMEGQVVLSLNNWKPYPIVDRGTLKASVTSYPIDNGARVQVGGGAAGYARFVEYGTRPHWPPLPVLMAWVIRKRLADNPADVVCLNADEHDAISGSFK